MNEECLSDASDDEHVREKDEIVCLFFAVE